MSRIIDADEAKRIAREHLIDPYHVMSACAVIDKTPTLTPPNEPLTIEQLREMDGEPVWLDVAGGVWALVDADDDCVWLDRGGSIDINKLAGNAYRRPPER